MAQYVFTLNGVGKMVPPNNMILKNISLSFFPGAKIGLLGYNGAGKSTLLKIMAGVDKDFIGEARPMKDMSIGYLAQEPELDYEKNVRDNVEEGLTHIKDAQKNLEAIYAAYAEPDADFEQLAKQQSHYENILQSSDAYNIEYKLEIASSALRLPPWDMLVKHLSGGEKRRVALCKLLVSHPDMLILDEPTNHLDAESVAWLERYLHEFQGTVVAVTHDRYFLDNVAGWILELDRGEGIPWEGNYSSWLDQKEKRLKTEQRTEQERLKSMQTELEWVRTNAKGRQTKNKARLKRFEELNSTEYQKRAETNEIYIPPGPRLGNVVVEASGISKSYGDNLLYDNLNFMLPPGGIVGIIGPNGAGKTTLFRMIVGHEQPSSGTLRVGETVKIAYVDQSRDQLEAGRTVFEEISGGHEQMLVNGYSVASRRYVGRFNFKGADQQKKVETLSGGERNRVHLAKVLASGGNVLLLDEPTNDLDVETLRALENALLDFPGSAVIISHDRWFLDRVATHILAFEDSGEVNWFEGGYSEYEAARQKHSKDQSPSKKRYKKLK